MERGYWWSMHDNEELGKIEQAAVRLLGETGCRLEHEGLLDLMEGAGCQVNRTAHRCFIPENLIRTVLEHFGAPADETVRINRSWDRDRPLLQSGSYPHILEWPSGNRRLATLNDVAWAAKMGHMISEIQTVGRVLSASDVESKIEPMINTLVLALTTDKKIGGGEVFHHEYIEPMVRIGEVLSGMPGDTSLLSGCDFFTAPLTLDRKQAECFLEKRRFGIEIVPGTMPISGISAPVTIAGTVTVAVAELITGWVMGYAVSPELGAGGIVATGSLDLKSLSACFGSPEALLQDMTVTSLCRRLYGIRVWPATNYVDCRTPGFEAAFQKLFPLIAVPYGTGTTIADGGGLLSAGQDYSPVQHLIDAQMSSAFARFNGGFEINEDTIAFDLIRDSAESGFTNFLDTQHTFDHYRSEQWYPAWGRRVPWQGTETETREEMRVMNSINDHIRRAVAAYQPPDIDEGKTREISSIIRNAETRILGRIDIEPETVRDRVRKRAPLLRGRQRRTGKQKNAGITV